MAIFDSRYGTLEIYEVGDGGINISFSYYDGNDKYNFSANEHLSAKETIELYKALGDYLGLNDKPDLEN
jgi:hypothetical protein